MVGDIVLTPFPFTDMSQSKIRPALVLADVGNSRESDWVVCEITTSPLARVREIVIGANDLQAGSLRAGSKARTDRLVTLDERVFLRTIGRLTNAKQAQIAAAVRALF